MSRPCGSSKPTPIRLNGEATKPTRNTKKEEKQWRPIPKGQEKHQGKPPPHHQRGGGGARRRMRSLHSLCFTSQRAWTVLGFGGREKLLPLWFGRRKMRCISVCLSSVPRLVVLNATVKNAMSRAKINLSYADDVLRSFACIIVTIFLRWLLSIAGACFTSTPARFCVSVLNAMY